MQFPSKFFDSHERKNEHATVIVHCERRKKTKETKQANENVNEIDPKLSFLCQKHV